MRSEAAAVAAVLGYRSPPPGALRDYVEALAAHAAERAAAERAAEHPDQAVLASCARAARAHEALVEFTGGEAGRRR